MVSHTSSLWSMTKFRLAQIEAATLALRAMLPDNCSGSLPDDVPTGSRFALIATRSPVAVIFSGFGEYRSPIETTDLLSMSRPHLSTRSPRRPSFRALDGVRTRIGSETVMRVLRERGRVRSEDARGSRLRCGKASGPYASARTLSRYRLSNRPLLGATARPPIGARPAGHSENLSTRQGRHGLPTTTR